MPPNANKKKRPKLDTFKYTWHESAPEPPEFVSTSVAGPSGGLSSHQSRRVEVEEYTSVPKAKRPRTEPLDPVEPVPPPSSDLPSDSGKTSFEKPHGAASFMQEYSALFSTCLDYILASESNPTIGTPCSCGEKGAVRVCMCRECTFFEPSCEKCYVKAHTTMPLHWAEVWNGSFFHRCDISQLGHVITIGHSDDGSSCKYAKSVVDFIIVDVTGVHSTKVQFCACHSMTHINRVECLLRSQIFPATANEPRMGFTFNVLRDFHLQTLTSKKSAYDYIFAIRCRTDNAFPEKVPNPYKQFTKIERIWRALTLLKRSGQVHGIDIHFPFRPPGNVIVPCFSCPEPGFNVPNDQWEMDDEELRHINMLYLMVDGHFGLHQFGKPGRLDPQDVSLLSGQGLFPDDDSYNKFVKEHVMRSQEVKTHFLTLRGLTYPQKSTCSKFNAIEMQDKIKLAGCRITGAIGVACGRTGIFYALVDMQMGERYGNADFALYRTVRFFVCGRIVDQSLRGAIFFYYILVTYDVACQFYKRLKERFQSYSGNMIDISDIVDFMHLLVPKLHLYGHKPDCRIRYSLNYFKGAGRSHGEGIEQSWAESKQSGGSTRHMNHGKRHDTLNDFHIGWNWDKVRKMGTLLATKAQEARKQRQEKIDFFLDLSEARGVKSTKEWSKESTDAILVNGEWQSVYQVDLKKLPGQKTILKSLEDLGNQEDNAEKINSRSTCTQVINAGILIQEKQWELQRAIDSDNYTPEKISSERESLHTKIRRWRKHQVRAMPLLEALVVQSSEDKAKEKCSVSGNEEIEGVEKVKLFLPSDISPQHWTEYGLNAACEIELKLREGQANDAVAGICNMVTYRMLLRDVKNRDARGVTKNTRARSYIKGVEDKQATWAKQYREARTRILKLRCLTTSDDLPILHDAHMQAKNVVDPHELGDGSKTDSWIWSYGQLRNLDTKEKAAFLVATEKVQWFRARADMERWVEEVELLEEEFRRLIRSCRRMREVWTDLARIPSPTTTTTKYPVKRSISGESKTCGYTVYALQKADMYKQMEIDASTLFLAKEVDGSWPSEGETLRDHIMKRRPPMTVDDLTSDAVRDFELRDPLDTVSPYLSPAGPT
ncbi:hypothetical protein H0H93_014968 [Arthromyces matolae]|nr:hypothetical protein H0H93_014968 [Arthromyces matolae]